MSDFPHSLIEFQQRFCDEAACVRYLFAARWPEGFVCPGCGKAKAWELQTKPWTWECAGCGKQTSVTAGTIMHPKYAGSISQLLIRIRNAYGRSLRSFW